MTTMLFLVSTSFKDGKSRTSVQNKVAAAEFYWYDADDDYLLFTSINVEIGNLELEWGVNVDMDPAGGTLIASGYNDRVYPHDQWPAYNLYGHF